MESKEFKALKEQLLSCRRNGFDRMDAAERSAMESYCTDYKAFLDTSKTERLCAGEVVRLAEQAGYRPYVRGAAVKPGDKVYLCNRGKSVLLAHIGLALTAIAMSGMIGLLTGIWIAEHPRIAPPVMGVCNVLYTIPAISLLGILIPFSGIGNKTAVIALTVYGIMPMVHNTYVGLTTLDPDILEAARGMGSTGTQALFRVKLPMAAGVILAGVRNMVVMTISVAGIASFVGAGGLGVAVYRGITIYDPAMTAAGSILIALLAIVCDLALGALERYFKKRGS